MRHIISIALILAALPVILFGIAGSRGRLSRVPPIEVFPDMDRQAKLRPQEPNPFFANGVSSQLPPPGTVARSQPFQFPGQHRISHRHHEFCGGQPVAGG